MNVEKLYDLYSNNVYSVINSHMLATISDRSYDIHGYNLINRILIYIQNKYTTSLRSESGWDIVGRQVKHRASPIWVIDNVIKTEYIDPDTDEVIENIGLTPKEIEEAVRFGTINKVKHIDGIKCIPVFNVKDTVVKDSDIYKEFVYNERKQIKLSTILAVVNQEFGIDCVQGDEESSYDSESNIITIGKDELEDKVRVVATALFYQVGLHESAVDFMEEYNVEAEVLVRMMHICLSFICESIVSYCCPGYEVEADVYKDIEELELNEVETEVFIQMLSTIYDIVEEVICLINPSNHNISESTLRKAAELLNILEANEAIMKYRR